MTSRIYLNPISKKEIHVVSTHLIYHEPPQVEYQTIFHNPSFFLDTLRARRVCHAEEIKEEILCPHCCIATGGCQLNMRNPCNVCKR